MDSNCRLCQGSRWLCEDHPHVAWEHCDCGGAGVACLCNPKATVRWREVFAQIPKEPGEPLH